MAHDSSKFLYRAFAALVGLPLCAIAYLGLVFSRPPLKVPKPMMGKGGTAVAPPKVAIPRSLFVAMEERDNSQNRNTIQRAQIHLPVV